MLGDTRKKTAFVSYTLCPVLEKHFGKPGAYILQQLHYWLLLENTSLGIIHEHRQWFYNSHEQWVDCFRKHNVYLSISSIRRGLDLLESKGVIDVFCFPKPGNNINSYTINYQGLEAVVGEMLHTRLSEMPKTRGLDAQSFAVNNAHGDKLTDRFLLADEESVQRSELHFQPVHACVSKPAQSAHLNTLKPVQPAQMNRLINRYITTNPLTTNLSSEQANLPSQTAEMWGQSEQQERENLTIPVEMIRIWNDIIEANSAPVLMTQRRARYLVVAFTQFFNSDFNRWQNFCCKIASSRFLMGESSVSCWRVDLDWAIHFDKIRLICDGKRYTFGDRVVASDAGKPSHILAETGCQPTHSLSRQETASALKIRAQIQQILLVRYDDHQQALYKSWFEDTYITVQEDGDCTKEVHLYVKLGFIKEQLSIRFRGLCEQLFDQICVGLPVAKTPDISEEVGQVCGAKS